MFNRYAIKISSPKYSEAVQKCLFKDGYRWANGSKSIKHTGKKYIYTNNCGNMTFGRLDENYKKRLSQGYLPGYDNVILDLLGVLNERIL